MVSRNPKAGDVPVRPSLAAGACDTTGDTVLRVGDPSGEFSKSSESAWSAFKSRTGGGGGGGGAGEGGEKLPGWRFLFMPYRNVFQSIQRMTQLSTFSPSMKRPSW